MHSSALLPRLGGRLIADLPRAGRWLAKGGAFFAVSFLAGAVLALGARWFVAWQRQWLAVSARRFAVWQLHWLWAR